MMEDDLTLAIEKFASKVQPIYRLLNWEWDRTGVPNERQIAVVMDSLVRNLVKSGDQEIQGGGLFVRRRYGDNRCFEFGLLIQEDWEIDTSGWQ